MTLTTDTKLVPDSITNLEQHTEFYQQSTEKIAENFNLNLENGLSDKQVSENLAHYGKNELIEKASTSIWVLIYAQIAEPLVIILLLAAGVSALLGKIPEFIAILAIVVLNAILGIFQEYRAEQARLLPSRR